MPYRIFDLNEVAQYLHLARGDVERLVKNQDIPFQKRGSRLVFPKVDIDSWASQRILGLKGRGLSDYHQKTSAAAATFLRNQALMPALLKPEFINPALPAKTKASVIREMVALASRTGRVSDSKALLESIEAREALCSTGIPGGLALLHPRYPDPGIIESSFIAIGRTLHGIPFGSPDGSSTDLFFLLGITDDRLHLHTLARLCLMAQKTDFLSKLRETADAEASWQTILSAEALVVREKA